MTSGRLTGELDLCGRRERPDSDHECDDSSDQNPQLSRAKLEIVELKPAKSLPHGTGKSGPQFEAPI